MQMLTMKVEVAKNIRQSSFSYSRDKDRHFIMVKRFSSLGEHNNSKFVCTQHHALKMKLAKIERNKGETGLQFEKNVCCHHLYNNLMKILADTVTREK